MRVRDSEGVPRKRQGEGWWILLQESANAVDRSGERLELCG